MKVTMTSILMTFSGLLLISSTTIASGQGQDGQAGPVGQVGRNGQSGKIGINWTPVDPNPEYFFYIPIKSGDVEAFQKVLAGGAKINWPMSNIVGRPTAFEVAMESRWIEGLRIMFQNPDPKNKPRTYVQVKTDKNVSVNIYEFLTLGEKLNSVGELTTTSFAVRTENLEILKMMVDAETDLEWLTRATEKVLPTLTANTNGYATYPNNVEARKVIESKIAELGAKK